MWNRVRREVGESARRVEMRNGNGFHLIVMKWWITLMKEVKLCVSPSVSPWEKKSSNWIYGAHRATANFIIIPTKPQYYIQIYIFTRFLLCIFFCSIFARPPQSSIPLNKISNIFIFHMRTFPYNLCTSNSNQFSSTIKWTETTTTTPRMGFCIQPYARATVNCV